MKTTMLVTGWIAAAAVGAWWALSPKEGVAHAAGKTVPEHAVAAVRMEADCESAADGAAEAPVSAAAVSGGSELEPWQKGVKMKSRNPDWTPDFAWGPEIIYKLLGDVPPDIQALAQRVMDGYEDTIFKDDQEAAFRNLFACSRDAAICPDPVVRYMMVAALSAWINIVPNDRSNEEPLRRKVQSELSLFANDPNKHIARIARNRMYAALGLLSDPKLFAEAFEDAVASAGSVAREHCHWFSIFDSKSPRRSEAIAYVSRVIDRLPAGEGRTAAEGLYERVTGGKFTGIKDADQYVAWMDDLTEYGQKLFGTEARGRRFAELVDHANRAGGGDGGLDSDEIETASKAFQTPDGAFQYVRTKEWLRQEALRRYGDTEWAYAWYTRELEDYERQLQDEERRKLGDEEKRESEKNNERGEAGE